MGSLWRHILSSFVTLVCACMLSFAVLPPALADLGDRVTNIATVSQDTADGRLVFQTNPAEFTIQARSTPSEIEFFRIAGNLPDAVPIQLNGSDYSPNGDLSGPFVPIGATNTFAQKPLDTSNPVNLVPAQSYLSGELMVVRVIDEGQNGNPSRIETVVITVEADNGDSITLRLYESGPDTGHFYAYFPSSALSTPQNDATITAPQDTVLQATYVDAFDATEVSVDTALVDPFGRVFDSFTGDLLNGVSVTIIDDVTGLPATVMGVDGIGTYPSSVQTGEDAADSADIVYPGSDGVFLFPILPPGTYRFEVSAPEGYIYPSARSEADFANLPTAPFEIDAAGSYGAAFTLTQSGPVRLDIPLDPNGDLIVRKQASRIAASLGDFVGYTVELENQGNVPAPFTLQDTLPKGFRYASGSAHLNGVRIADPDIDRSGRVLSFAGHVVLPGETASLTYLAAVGPGASDGEAVNRAIALNSNGEALSNMAEAVVMIEEDLLTSRLTIIGRVVEAACQPEEEWARSIEDGTGVAGVRLYMETGRYVVTDEDGLFHFEGIRPGTHVVQVDEATLPPGYEPVICEENSRYAGSAVSKFVDAQGGMIWRANFYLKRTESAETAEAAATESMSDTERYGEAWLNQQSDSEVRWAYPAEGDTPPGRSLNLGIVHGPRQQVRLQLNGLPVSSLNFSGKDLSGARDVAISRWAGVDIQRGENVFEAIILDAEDNELERLIRRVWFVDEIDRARLVDDQSMLVADGRTKPRIAIRLEDGDGHAVHAGRLAEISVEEPYRLARTAEEEFEAPVDAAFAAVSGIRVGENGIAYVDLEPTLESGRVRLRVALQNGGFEELDVWLQPEKREWVLVGLAEAEGLLSNIDGEGGRDLDEVMSDGRFAFFAKGIVRGDWLLTVAVDTAKRRGGADGDIFDEIDPNAYYTLYGDRTWQNNNAESRYPVYVKLEKDMFQAVFGDYETGFTETELGRYSRRLSGLKADYESEQVSITAFAAETNQRFQKDELAADGTSGPFRLSLAPLVRTSEVIIVETRNRFRPDEIVSARPLNRYADYEIDYTTGELFFRHPIAATDEALNPNVIVIDYETSEVSERGITAGLRAETRFAGDMLQTGVTLVHEEDGASTGFDGSNLIAADITLRPDKQTEIRAEIAATDAETEQGEVSGEAVLLEAIRQTDTLRISAYFREESEGFGLGQQASSTSSLRRVGAQLSAELGVSDVAGGTDRSVRRLEAQIYDEKNLSQNARRTVGDIALRQDSQAFGASIGLRAVAEDYEGQADPRQSVLLTGGIRKTFLDHGLTLTAAHEEPVYTGGANDDEATLFPGRTIVGLDKTLGQRARFSLRHEVVNGSDASGENTIAGISWEPRTGTELRAATDMITSDAGRRIGATVGVDQTWQIDKQWTLGAGLARRANVDGGDTPLDPTADAAVSPLEDGVRSSLVEDETYTSAYFGFGYRGEATAASGRVELRDSASGERLVAVLGGAREITRTLSFTAAARHQNEALATGKRTQQTDVRFGAAWRPRGEDLVILNRLDINANKIDGLQNESKIVNNLAVNTMLSDRTQLSVYHGVKRVKTSFQGASATGVTHLLGGEVRHDLTRKLDLGLHGTWTSGGATGTESWSFGPSVGLTPKENVWVSLGWNVSGFEDEDFEAARYTQQGPYLKIRAKFDQNTVKGLMQSLGLGVE